MTGHISQDVLKGKAPNSPKATQGVYQSSKGSRQELAEEYARNLLPAVRSRLIARDRDGRPIP